MLADPFGVAVLLKVVEKTLTDGELATAEVHIRVPDGFDLFERRVEQSCHVLRLERRADRRHAHSFRDLRGRGEHGGTPEAVTHQQRGRPIRFPQRARGRDDVAHVVREGRAIEFPLALAKPSEVEPQRCNPLLCER